MIRLATPADTEFLACANERMALETEHKVLPPATIRAGVARVLADPQLGRYYVAECDGRPVGCLMITYEWSDWRNKVFWWIQSVYVRPEFRGQGVYRSLYEGVKTMAKASDCCGFRLYVENTNEAAQAVYKKLGMEQSHYLMFEDQQF
jgi:GNAT superfamily N-acetyltransferase